MRVLVMMRQFALGPSEYDPWLELEHCARNCKSALIRDNGPPSIMDDSRRARAEQKTGDGAPSEEALAQTARSEAQAPALRQAAGANAQPQGRPHASDARYLGMMKSLFESADVSIRREDETRVLSRAQEAIAEIEKRKGIALGELGSQAAAQRSAGGPKSVPPARSNPPAGSGQAGGSAPPPSDLPTSIPSGPRVDLGLWLVLAVGLFVIAGWMLLYGL